MNSLPKSYSQIARKITGYCGTFPPSMELKPGSVGRFVDGSLVKEGDLSQYPGFKRTNHRIGDDPSGESTQIWMTSGVRMETVDAKAEISAGAGGARVRMRFEGADDAIIICKDGHIRSFSDGRAIKDYVWQLFGKHKWDRDAVLVTEVFQAAAAWILIATDRNQAQEVGVAAPLALMASPLELLKSIAGSASLDFSSSGGRSTSFISALQSTCTPLFKAIRIKRIALFGSHFDYVKKGPDPRFEEATPVEVLLTTSTN